jgi:hypothetical protein
MDYSGQLRFPIRDPGQALKFRCAPNTGFDDLETKIEKGLQQKQPQIWN